MFGCMEPYLGNVYINFARSISIFPTSLSLSHTQPTIDLIGYVAKDPLHERGKVPLQCTYTLFGLITRP